MPPTIDPKVLAVVERVFASKCSIVSAVRDTRAPHFNPQHWLLCHMGLY